MDSSVLADTGSRLNPRRSNGDRPAPVRRAGAFFQVFAAAALSLSVVVAAALPVTAQTPAQPDPPFLKDLERLAEILGSVHYLSAICSDGGNSPWRGKMEALIETEFRSPELRRRAVARFNLGYQSYANIHNDCTAAAEITLNRYLAEGADITDRVARRYGR